MRRDLIERSIEVIKEGQAPTGAYVACPRYPTYNYCWFRDGSFVAVAMDTVGESESARRFHDWAASAIVDRRGIVERLEAGETGGRLVLDTRYRLDGTVGEEEWPNFQLDGFGTWLWSMGEHSALTGEVHDLWIEAADLVARYLTILWDRPCYDCWEEFPEEIHTHTLGTIHAGLRSAEQLTKSSHSETLAAIERLILERGVVDGRLTKHLRTRMPDASLMGLGVPYGVFAPDGDLMVNTITEIERSLLGGGGVHRYPTDTFYGGGQWVLLTSWLAWHHRVVGNADRQSALLDWVENQADENLWLPEQVSEVVNDPDYVQPWVDRWGAVASPLLWSHAMYILATGGPAVS